MMELLAVFTNTAQVLAIDFDGVEVVVQTTGGTERYSPDGEWLGVDPTAREHRVSAPFEGGELVGGLDGELTFLIGDQEVSWELGCPILDISEEGRVACLFTAYEFTWHPEEVVVPATAAGPGAWGLANGSILDDEGVVGRVPGRVTALERVGQAWFVGTADGLYRLDQDLVRLTPEGQICGNFITGTATYRDELIVSTFDRGACRFDGQRWHRIDLPTELVNDVAVHDDSLWFATGSGLVRTDLESVETFPAASWGLERGSPGTHHRAVNDVAVGERFWSVDVLGPVSRDAQGYWRRHRFSVYGTSYQAVAACGEVAVASSEDAGLTIFDGRRWRQHDANGALPDEWVMAVECDSADAVWAGLYDDGLWFWDGRAWSQQPVPDLWILSLARSQDELFIGTMGGLFLSSGEEIWTPDPRVHHLEVSEETVYVGTEGGLAVYSRPLEERAVVAGDTGL